MGERVYFDNDAQWGLTSHVLRIMWLVSIWLAGCRSFHDCCRYYGVRNTKFKSPDSQFLGWFRVSVWFSGDYAWMFFCFSTETQPASRLSSDNTGHQLVLRSIPYLDYYRALCTSPYSISGLAPKPQVDSYLLLLLESKTAYAYPKPTGHTLVGRGSSFPAWINWNSGLTKTRHDDSRPSLLYCVLCVCTGWH